MITSLQCIESVNKIGRVPDFDHICVILHSDEINKSIVNVLSIF